MCPCLCLYTACKEVPTQAWFWEHQLFVGHAWKANQLTDEKGLTVIPEEDRGEEENGIDRPQDERENL